MTTKTPTPHAEPAPGLSPLPDSARACLIKRMTEYVAASFRARAEEVLEAPAEYEPDLHGVRWQICGAFGEDMCHEYGEAMEDMILQAYKEAGLPTSFTTPDHEPHMKTGTALSGPAKP